MDKIEKLAQILALLGLSNCAAIGGIAGGYAAIHTASEVAQEATATSSEVPTQTLTEWDYQACKRGDDNACLRSAAYTIAFGIPDRAIAAGLVLTGQAEPSLLLASHGEIHHEADKKIPTISCKQANYGGVKWNQFSQFYKGESCL